LGYFSAFALSFSVISVTTGLFANYGSGLQLGYSIEHGAVGASCNPVIVLGILKKEMKLWSGRIRELIRPAAWDGGSDRVAIG
jgi:hypothetical protein